MSAPLSLLVVDDQQSIRCLCAAIAAELGFLCAEAESAEAALESLAAHQPDIVLADLRMKSMSGLDLLAAIKRLRPQTEVAIMTGFGSIEGAVEAMKLGACDYLTKPFRAEELRALLQRLCAGSQPPIHSDATAKNFVTDLGALERATIERVFSQVRGDKHLAQQMLGISRATLYRKLKRYHIATPLPGGK